VFYYWRLVFVLYYLCEDPPNFPSICGIVTSSSFISGGVVDDRYDRTKTETKVGTYI